MTNAEQYMGIDLTSKRILLLQLDQITAQIEAITKS